MTHSNILIWICISYVIFISIIFVFLIQIFYNNDKYNCFICICYFLFLDAQKYCSVKIE